MAEDGKDSNRRLLTDQLLKGLRLKPAPKGTRYFVWDKRQPYLGARVTDKGHVSLCVVRRRAGERRPTYVTIGPHPAISVPLGRELAEGHLKTLETGLDPLTVEKERIKAEALLKSDTIGIVAEDFIKRHVSRLAKKNAKATASRIRHELLGLKKLPDGRWVPDPNRKHHLRDRPIGEVTRREIIQLIEGIIDRGTRSQARKVHADASKLFNWALHRGSYPIQFNPCASIKTADLIGTLPARTRVLEDWELRLIWQACGRLFELAPMIRPSLVTRVIDDKGYPIAPLVKALMLTGQRLLEIAHMRWCETNLEKANLVVPAERMKGHIMHTVPLSPTMLTVLTELPNFQGREGADFVFSTTWGKRPISGFSKAKLRLDRAVVALIEEERAAGRATESLAPWTFHDLRRTMRTRLSGLGVADVVAELVIAHHQKGIRKVYDLYRFDAEKREALERWDLALRRIVAQPEPEPQSGPSRPRRVSWRRKLVQRRDAADAASNIIAMPRRR
jgi:integrase